MLFGVLVSKAFDLFGFPVDASFGKQYIKEDQQESQIKQQPLETSTPKSINRKGK
jgi:hypothetical protein